jgi:hypothetical protein
MPQSLNEIAVAIVELLGVDDDKAAIAEIERQLSAVRRAYQDGGDVKKAAQLRADIAAERRRLQKLKNKWCRIAAAETVFGEADQWLAVLSNVHGPARYRWFDDVCAIMARSMILHSPDTRLGDRLRELAGYLYEAATDIPSRDLETACRRVTQKAKLVLVFEHDKRDATRGVGRYVWRKEKRQAKRKKK